MSKDGEISKPVLSGFGYHIIKRLSRKPVPEKDKETLTGLKQKVITDPRVSVATKKFLNKIFAQTNFKRSLINENHFSVYTDSILQHKPGPPFADMNDNTMLFSINNKNYIVKQWLDYARGAKNTRQLSVQEKRTLNCWINLLK